MRALIVFCALVLIPVAALGAGQVGETAPDFTLQNTAGETVEVTFPYDQRMDGATLMMNKR